MKEFVVWGIPPGDEYENVLYTRATTAAEAGRVAATLEREHGCRKTRVQILDMSADGAAVAEMFRGSVRKNNPLTQESR